MVEAPIFFHRHRRRADGKRKQMKNKALLVVLAGDGHVDRAGRSWLQHRAAAVLCPGYDTLSPLLSCPGGKREAKAIDSLAGMRL